MAKAVRKIVVVGTALLAIAACSKKQELDLSAVAPFEDLFTDEEIRQGFVNLQTTPFGREDLAFSLLVPKDWRDIPVTVPRQTFERANEEFVPLCRQLAPEGEPGKPTIEVQFLKLDLEIGLTDFVINYLESNQLKPLAHNRAKFNGRYVEDVVIGVVQDGEDYVARMTFSRHGDKLFLVVGSARSDYFMNWARHFGLAAVTFTPRKKPESEFAEPMSTYVNPGPPYLEFRHPKSWVRREPSDLPAGKVGVDIMLMVEDKTFGLIHVKAANKTPELTPDVVLQRLKRDFESSGVFVGALLRESALDAKQPKPLTWLQVWQAKHDGVPGELATLVLQDQTAVYSIGLLVPPRDQNTLAWMTSWRVFEIVYQDVIENLNRVREVSP